MTLWLDAHISPQLVPWIQDTFGKCLHYKKNPTFELK